MVVWIRDDQWRRREPPHSPLVKTLLASTWTASRHSTQIHRPSLRLTSKGKSNLPNTYTHTLQPNFNNKQFFFFQFYFYYYILENKKIYYFFIILEYYSSLYIIICIFFSTFFFSFWSSFKQIIIFNKFNFKK